MKNVLFLCFYSLMATVCISQKAEIPLIFEDSAGNKDTIIIGYYDFATSGIDSIFGEVNLIGSPFDSVFEVRITDEWFSRDEPGPSSSIGSYHTKKQIIPTPQQGQCWMIEIDFVSRNWPFVVRWDNTLFEGSAIQETVITDFHPGGWFDVGPWEISTCMLPDSMAIFVAKPPDYYLKYTDSFQDTIFTIFVGSGFHCSAYPHLCEVKVGLEQGPRYSPIEIFPNPAFGAIHFQSIRSIQKVQLYSQHGQLIKEYDNVSTLDIEGIENGIYFLVLYEGNSRTIKKIIKTD